MRAILLFEGEKKHLIAHPYHNHLEDEHKKCSFLSFIFSTPLLIFYPRPNFFLSPPPVVQFAGGGLKFKATNYPLNKRHERKSKKVNLIAYLFLCLMNAKMCDENFGYSEIIFLLSSFLFIRREMRHFYANFCVTEERKLWNLDTRCFARQ